MPATVRQDGHAARLGEQAVELAALGKGPVAAQATAETATPAGATRLVVIGRDEARCTIEGVGLALAVTGGTGEFRFAFTLF
jgi:hypothetical protein